MAATNKALNAYELDYQAVMPVKVLASETETAKEKEELHYHNCEAKSV